MIKTELVKHSPPSRWNMSSPFLYPLLYFPHKGRHVSDEKKLAVSQSPSFIACAWRITLTFYCLIIREEPLFHPQKSPSISRPFFPMPIVPRKKSRTTLYIHYIYCTLYIKTNKRPKIFQRKSRHARYCGLSAGHDLSFFWRSMLVNFCSSSEIRSPLGSVIIDIRVHTSYASLSISMR